MIRYALDEWELTLAYGTLVTSLIGLVVFGVELAQAL